jgi:hypothetical protein
MGIGMGMGTGTCMAMGRGVEAGLSAPTSRSSRVRAKVLSVARNGGGNRDAPTFSSPSCFSSSLMVPIPAALI